MSKKDADTLSELEPEQETEAVSPRPIAYVRPVSKEEIAEQLPDDAPDGPYFAVHDEEGRPLALFTDQDAAFVAAKVHHYSPVHVH